MFWRLVGLSKIFCLGQEGNRNHLQLKNSSQIKSPVNKQPDMWLGPDLKLHRGLNGLGLKKRTFFPDFIEA